MVSVDSSIGVSSCLFKNLAITRTVFDLTQSNFTLHNTQIVEVEAAESVRVLVLSSAQAVLQQVIYQNSTAGFMLATYSTLTLQRLSIGNNISRVYPLYIYSSIVDQISHSIFDSVSSQSGVIFHIEKSEINSIQNLTISNTSEVALKSDYSKMISIDGLNLLQCDLGFQLKESMVVLLKNSNFQACGTINNIQGGAFYAEYSNTTIQNSTFHNNLAKNGAGTYFNCDQTNQCSNKIINCIFENNKASIKGGGIYYTMNRPQLDNNIFNNNSAQYGTDIGSYPVRIVQTGTTNNIISINNVASGLVYNETLQFTLVDYDNQVMNLENENTLKITAISENASISGTDYTKLAGGVGSFSSLTFVAKAGMDNVQYQVTSKAIDSSKVRVIAGTTQNYQSQYITKSKW